MATPKTIILKGEPIQKEALAHETLTPGELVQFDATSGKLKKHATAGGTAPKYFVVEEDFVGDDIDTTYLANESAQYIVAHSGDEVYGWCSTSQTIKKGDALVSDGAGNLAKFTAQAVNEAGSGSYTIYLNAIVAFAAEDKTTTGTRARIKVEVA